jgi:hypothetical protein
LSQFASQSSEVDFACLKSTSEGIVKLALLHQFLDTNKN